ncbi:Vms1/Ankzf1 family peptidyl-tRNA hydrolase [Amycolatopsis nigrescens]|uniref:Rv2629 family ribosome hibernation factor n=1 Tax=Amycolatopsis nigrescens TaxID=381445 RepID=UPI00036E4B52|nr:Vms1/Ankzf1 family peptidyl-tRNA hydrolase [Amycolatopsis nigrescens]
MHTKELRALAEETGPFASVYFEDSHDTADAEKQLELKWRELRTELAGHGAGEVVLDRLEHSVFDQERPVGRSARALVATEDRLLVDQELTWPPAAPVARFSTLPYLLPLVTGGRRGPSYLLATADRVGAEISVVDEAGRPLEAEAVEGEDHPVHKVRGGGLSHRRIQSAVEETVRHNLEDVAEEVAKVAARTGVQLIVLAGEVQARTQLRDALPEQARRMSTELTGGEVERELDELLTTWRLGALDELAERFRAESGRDTGLAVQGLTAVTTALREGNVAHLLVTEPGAETVHRGAGAAQVAASATELSALGTAEAEHRADEAVPLAALAVGAEITGFDERLRLTDGFGALLRHG